MERSKGSTLKYPRGVSARKQASHPPLFLDSPGPSLTPQPAPFSPVLYSFIHLFPHSQYIFKKYIYLFIWLHWVLVAAGGLLSCGTWAP